MCAASCILQDSLLQAALWCQAQLLSLGSMQVVWWQSFQERTAKAVEAEPDVFAGDKVRCSHLL